MRSRWDRSRPLSDEGDNGNGEPDCRGECEGIGKQVHTRYAERVEDEQAGGDARVHQHRHEEAPRAVVDPGHDNPERRQVSDKDAEGYRRQEDGHREVSGCRAAGPDVRQQVPGVPPDADDQPRRHNTVTTSHRRDREPSPPQFLEDARGQPHGKADHHQRCLVIRDDNARDERRRDCRQSEQSRGHQDWSGQDGYRVPAGGHAPPERASEKRAQAGPARDDRRQQDACHTWTGEHRHQCVSEPGIARRRGSQHATRSADRQKGAAPGHRKRQREVGAHRMSRGERPDGRHDALGSGYAASLSSAGERAARATESDGVDSARC